MQCNPVRWFEIYVQEMERARKFYEQVLNLKLQRLEPPPGLTIELFAFPMEKDRVGAGGALVKMPGVASGSNSTIIYFGCDDCAQEESRVIAAGGKIEKSKFSIGQYGSISLVYDTEGNMFGLHSVESECCG